MKIKLLMAALFFISVFLIIVTYWIQSDIGCTSSCTLIVSPAGDTTLKNGLPGLISKLGSGQETREFNMEYIMNDTDGFFYIYKKKLDLISPKQMEFKKGKVYLVEVKKSVFNLYFVKSSKEYDAVSIYHLPGFNKYCWDYDCDSDLPPYKKLPEEFKVLHFFQIEEDAGDGIKPAPLELPSPPPRDGPLGIPYSASPSKPTVLAKGNLDVIVVPLYAESSIPPELISAIKGITNTTPDESFMYVSTWYRVQAGELSGKPDLMNLNIDFVDAQKVPIELILSPDDECDLGENMDYIKSTLKEVESYDILVLLYYGNHTCQPHAGLSSKSVLLFVHPRSPEDFQSHTFQSLTRTFAHELSHLFGAEDKYTDVYEISSGIEACCFIEPDASELQGRDIMCHRVRTLDEEFGCIQPPLSELIISEASAKEIGWHDLDGDGILEVEDPCPWNKENRNCSPFLS